MNHVKRIANILALSHSIFCVSVATTSLLFNYALSAGGEKPLNHKRIWKNALIGGLNWPFTIYVHFVYGVNARMEINYLDITPASSIYKPIKSLE